MVISKFLGRILMLDALSCLAMGAALVIGTDLLAPLFGLEPGFALGAGLALLPVGLLILWTGTRNQVPAMLVYAIIAGNALWILESLVTAATFPTITPAGTAFVIAQAASVALLTILEMMGVRRSITTAL
ncbi:hypothetical protein [Sphingosinicella rhizophila]|uniref:Uncharacterized protein n=1 Tax=Sphingosinicella rhizophila TaxID=3050082 RepID=A0ABU3QBH9_9SPHN|nr:hypothetical protein [Sphingosinicella sp. GR2756]MDT9600759.1 hypothetical protein [Sphingosinicella sp. GR2756]